MTWTENPVNNNTEINETTENTEEKITQNNAKIDERKDDNKNKNYSTETKMNYKILFDIISSNSYTLNCLKNFI